MQVVKKLLFAGAIMPVLYFTLLYTAGALYPDYSHVRQVASDLGADGAPYGWALEFNIGLVYVGLAGIAGAIGLFQGLRRLGGGFILTSVTSTVIVLPSVIMVMSGLFPLPSPWHANFHILLTGNLVPLFGALALRAMPNAATIRLLLIVGFGVNMGITGVLFGIGDLVNEGNLGLWLRLWVAAMLPQIGFLCWVVRSRLQAYSSW